MSNCAQHPDYKGAMGYCPRCRIAELQAENKRLWSEQHEAQRVYRRLLTELEEQRGINEEQSKQLAALKSISLNGALSWQDRHISSFKVLNPELLKEKGE